MADSSISFPATSKAKIFPPLGCTIAICGSRKVKKEFPDTFQIDPQMIMLNVVIKIKGKFTYSWVPSLGDKSHRVFVNFEGIGLIQCLRH